MNQELLNDSSELKMTIRFKSKKYGNPEYKYICFVMTSGKKFFANPDWRLPVNIECEKIQKDGPEVYMYTVSFYPKNYMKINDFGGFTGIFRNIQRINDFYIKDPDTGYEYEDADFESIEIEYKGMVHKGMFV